MSTDTSIGITVIVAPPIDSLAELRRQHSALLQRNVAGEGTAKPSPGELLGFLTSAAKLGRSLDDVDARETAQGIMDFWIAVLLSRAPEAADGTRPFTLESYDEARADAAATAAQKSRAEAVEAAKRADDILPAPTQIEGLKTPVLARILGLIPGWLQPLAHKMTGYDSGANIQQRLLLHFVRLKERSLEAYSIPLPGDEEILQEPGAKELLQKLIQAGVVKQQPPEGSAPPSYVLTHDSLVVKWGLLNEVVTQRKAFRELARGWENGGRQPAALLNTGAQLLQAIDYPHLESAEQQFLECSRRTGENNRKIILSFLSTVLIVLLGMVIWLELNYRRLAAVNSSLDEALAAERAAKDAADTKAAELTRANESLNQSYLSFSQLAVQQEKLTNTKRSQLLSLRDQLKEGQGLSDSVSKTLDAALQEPAAPSAEMVEVFVSLHADLKPTGVAQACRAELEKEGFSLPAGVVLPRRFVPDGTTALTEIKYFHKEDLPMVSKVIAALGRAGIPKEQITTENKTSDASAPAHFIQVSISENWTR